MIIHLVRISDLMKICEVADQEPEVILFEPNQKKFYESRLCSRCEDVLGYWHRQVKLGA